MKPTHASPNIRWDEVDPRKTDDRIRIFEDRLRLLVLAHARTLLQRQEEEGQFAALQLVLPYFESFHSYRTGRPSRSHSADFFRYGFLSVFPGPSEVKPADAKPVAGNFMLELADTVYDEARCGLFHDGLTRYRIQVVPTPDAPPIVVDLGPAGGILSVTIGVFQFVNAIEGHLDRYLAEVRSSENATLRRAFDRTWNRFHRQNEAFRDAL